MIEAATADHDAVAAAIESSGLTVAEVADRAGLDPAQLHRFPLDRVPLAVLSRLADVVGVPLRQLLNRWRDGYPEDWGERSVVGAYLAEFKDGLSRDQLSDALGWTLQRVEHALGALDAALEEVGMRLARNADRVVVVGRFERTEPAARLDLQRLTAPDLDPKLAAFIWDALAGIVPARVKDQEALELADRLGLIVGWYGRIRVSQAVAYSLDPWTHRYYLGPGY